MRTTIKLGATLALAMAAWSVSAANTATPSEPSLATLREMPQLPSAPVQTAPRWALDMRSSPCWAVATFKPLRGPSQDYAFNVLNVLRYRTESQSVVARNSWFQLVAEMGDGRLLTLAAAESREELFPVLAYYMERTADCEGRQPQRPGYYLPKPTVPGQP